MEAATDGCCPRPRPANTAAALQVSIDKLKDDGKMVSLTLEATEHSSGS